MTRVLVGGYYGYGNLGDELILTAMLARLRALRPGLAVTVTSADPAQTASRHGVEAVDWSDIAALAGAMGASEAAILGGGGLFHDYWGCDKGALLQRHHAGLAQYAAVPLLASLLDKPLMIYGVGVGPLLTDSGRELTAAAFEQASVATVRDAPSRARLAEIGVDTARVEVTADPAFDLALPAADASPAPAGAGAPPGPRVGVALRTWSQGPAGEQWEKEVAEGLDLFLDRRGGEAVFVPFQDAPEPFGDQPVADRVRARMRPGRHRALAAGSAPAARLLALAGCDVVLGMRLHALVVGARAGRPLIALAYDPKVAAVMASLDVPDHGIDLVALTGGMLADRLDDAWQRRGEIGPRVAEAAAALALRARTNADRAIALFDGGPGVPASERAARLGRQATLRLAAAVDEINRKAADERARLQVRLEEAEAALQRWESSRTGRLMRVWRRWRR